MIAASTSFLKELSFCLSLRQVSVAKFGMCISKFGMAVSNFGMEISKFETENCIGRKIILTETINHGDWPLIVFEK